MEQIKIIENNIIEILGEGKELIELTEKFDNLLQNLDNGFSNLENNRMKLFNTLLKYPKKKMLFDYKSQDKTYTYRIGVNENGLGIISQYEHNLRRSSGDYWGSQVFNGLFKEDKFKKLLLEKINPKHKSIIAKLMLSNIEKYPSKEIKLGNIRICINDRGLRFFTEDGVSEDYSTEINIIRTTDFQKIEKGDSDFIFSELFGYRSRFDFEGLAKFGYLLKYKDKIIKKLNEEIIGYEKIEAKLKLETAKIDVELKPYLALKQI